MIFCILTDLASYMIIWRDGCFFFAIGMTENDIRGGNVKAGMNGK